MEILYRIFTWIVVGAVMLIPAGIVWVLSAHQLPPILHGTLGVAVYGALLWLGQRKFIAEDRPVEPRRKSRLQSLLLCVVALYLVYLVWSLVTFFCGPLKYCLGINADYLLIPIFVLLAGAIILFRPFAKHKKGTSIVVTGVLVGLFWNVYCSIGSGKTFDHRGKRLPIGYEMPIVWQERFFPAGATDFEIEGKSLFFTEFVNWSCRVSEKKFEAFRAKHNYHFVLNRTDVNEDTEVGPLGGSGEGDADWPKPFLYYNNRHANGGGLTMRYSIPEKKLYGFYSNR